jgi:hypothetical protein
VPADQLGAEMPHPAPPTTGMVVVVVVPAPVGRLRMVVVVLTRVLVQAQVAGVAQGGAVLGARLVRRTHLTFMPVQVLRDRVP